ncbi:hypothetical protein ACP70R_014615 [Stipagrostis hirtigluma subsp. patula]
MEMEGETEMEMEGETEMERRMAVEDPLKRGPVVDVGVEEEAAKKRKMEPDAEERKRLDAEAVAKFDRPLSEIDEELHTDFYAFQAKQFRKFWDSLYSDSIYGSFEDETTIEAMRFTDKQAPNAYPRSTLQIFSVKVAELRGDLQWPLDVYGMVAIRDTLDHNRNIIFQRKRDNCQTLTEKNPSLVLTGPTRAVMLNDLVIFEVQLFVREKNESEDKLLSFLAARFRSHAFPFDLDSWLIKKDYTSKLSTLEFTLGHIYLSVEATISVKVMKGSWQDDFQGQFVASTASIEDQEVVLLDFVDGKVPLNHGNILLSRSVVSVDHEGQLIVSVKTCQGNKGKVGAVEDQEVFTQGDKAKGHAAEDQEADKAKEAVEEVARVVFSPLEMGRSHGELNVGSCEMEVTVAWSLFGEHPAYMKYK